MQDPFDNSQPHETPDPWPTGTVISSTWIVEDRLGNGGFGAAYLVGHRFLARRKACIKRLNEQLNQDRDFVKSLVDEAIIMDAISDCPQIVQPWDVNRNEDNFVYICMEYMAGGSLSGVLEKLPNRQMDPIAALDIVRQILKALKHAHAAQILHLDVKAENILLKHAGIPYIVKLADFGIAHRIAESTRPLLDISQFRGAYSPGYTPLEQMVGRRRDLDGRSDLYALGMTLFRMLTGRYAFEFQKALEWPILVKGSEPPPPSRFRAELAKWRGVDEFVLKMIARAADDRFADATAALAALEQLRSPVGAKSARPKDVVPTEPIKPAVEATAAGSTPSRRGVLVASVLAPALGVAGYWMGARSSSLPSSSQPSTESKGASRESRETTEKLAEATVYGHLRSGDKQAAMAEVQKLRESVPDSAVAGRLESEIKQAP